MQLFFELLTPVPLMWFKVAWHSHPQHAAHSASISIPAPSVYRTLQCWLPSHGGWKYQRMLYPTPMPGVLSYLEAVPSYTRDTPNICKIRLFSLQRLKMRQVGGSGSGT